MELMSGNKRSRRARGRRSGHRRRVPRNALHPKRSGVLRAKRRRLRRVVRERKVAVEVGIGASVAARASSPP